MDNKYSIVSTVFNDEKCILELLDEMKAQSLQPDEVIIVDGGSSDNTLSIIEKYKKNSKLNIKVFSGERLNIAQGLNKGIINAKNEYVGIVACGNHYAPSFFDTLMETLIREKKCMVAYSLIEGSSKTLVGNAYIKQNIGENNCWKYDYPTNHGNLVRKKFYDVNGLFYERLIYAGEDTEYFIRAKTNDKDYFCTCETSVIWDVPQTWLDYKKQLKGYIMGDMQIFSNKKLIKKYQRKIVYSLLYVFALMFLCIPFRLLEIIGMMLIFCLALFNIQLLIRRGKIYYLMKQLSYIYSVITIIANYKLFFKRNKIEQPL